MEEPAASEGQPARRLERPVTRHGMSHDNRSTIELGMLRHLGGKA
jgi:hypothetical protein